MKTFKKIVSWAMPVILIAALLFTMNTFKRSETLTPEEQKKIEQYTNTQE
ncbi:CapE family protein [Peribacillus sp. NPDC097295]